MTQIESPVPAEASAGKSRYDAFISYRHVEPDRQWAKWLHTALETYRVPRKLMKQKGVPRRIERVFRDEEELPASDNLSSEIESALSQSRCLIVVCSPRTPQSLWVNKEVERFRQMGRHESILALLIEGEPAEAFPPALREIRHTVVDRDGSTYERVEEVEPLAADVRVTRHESLGYLRRMAKLRVMAALLGVKFDDLRQREQERRTRRVAIVGAMLGILLLVVGGLALFALKQRNIAVQQRQIAESRRLEAVAQRERAELELAQGTVLQGDLLGSAGRWLEARGKYNSAAALFQQNATPPLMAELGLWDASRHVTSPINTLAGHTDAVRAVAISPDGNQVISGAADKTVKLWDLRTGRLIRTLAGHGDSVHAVAFLPDGKRALSASDDKTIKLWDLATGNELHTFAGHAAGVHAMAVSVKGDQFITADAANQLKVWDIAGMKEIQAIDAKSAPMCLALSPDGKQALCGGLDNKVRLFDLATGALIQTFTGHDIAPALVAFVPGRKTIVSAGYDNTIRFWDLATGKQTGTFSNNTDRITSGALSPDGKVLVSGMWGGMLKSFDLPSGQERRAFIGHSSLVRQVAISPDGRTAVSAGTDKLVHIWDLWGAPAQHSWGYTGGAINGVGFTPDGLLAFTATSAGSMELWDIASEQTLYTARPPGFLIIASVLCPDGHTVLAGGLPGVVLVDLTGHKPPLAMNGHTESIECVAVSPDGKLGLSGSYDKTARVWDLSNGAQLRSLPHNGAVNSAAFSADGRLAVTGGLGGVRLWDAVTWKELRAIGKPGTDLAGPCSSALFSPDSRSILVGTQAGTVKLFDCDTGAERRTFAGAHTRIVGCLAFSRDGRLAVSGSDDHTIRMWNVESGAELRMLAGHDSTVRTIVFSPDGHSFLSGDLNGNLKLWDLTAADVDEKNLSITAAARVAADKSPEDPAAAAHLFAALGNEYAFRGLSTWAAHALEKARAGNVPVSPLLLGRSYWRSGDRAAAQREWVKAIAQKEAPEAYLSLCLEAITGKPATQPAPATAPAK